jgi:hypothetical protein
VKKKGREKNMECCIKRPMLPAISKVTQNWGPEYYPLLNKHPLRISIQSYLLLAAITHVHNWQTTRSASQLTTARPFYDLPHWHTPFKKREALHVVLQHYKTEIRFLRCNIHNNECSANVFDETNDFWHV